MMRRIQSTTESSTDTVEDLLNDFDDNDEKDWKLSDDIDFNVK